MISSLFPSLIPSLMTILVTVNIVTLGFALWFLFCAARDYITRKRFDPTDLKLRIIELTADVDHWHRRVSSLRSAIDMAVTVKPNVRLTITHTTHGMTTTVDYAEMADWWARVRDVLHNAQIRDDALVTLDPNVKHTTDQVAATFAAMRENFDKGMN